MFVTKIFLNNYRNYSNQTLQLKDGLNVLLGDNAQGKTNLLEAIYFCAIGKSPRLNRDINLIKWGEEKAKIELNFLKKEGRKKIEIFFNSATKKAIKINGVNILKISELFGNFNCIYFSPDELKLVKETPEDRRKFMDIDISQLSKNYFHALTKYNKILLERNKLLKSGQSREVILDTLPIWNEQLARVGANVILKRIRFLKKVNFYAKKSLSFLTDNSENLTLEYSNFNFETEEEIYNALIGKLQENLEKDLKLCYTTVGPHRDDIKIIVNNTDIRAFGSQGQQRTVALSLKLAELEIFREETGESPILLLDDVLSELDDNRCKRLLEICKTVQTIITTTKFNENIEANIIKIKNGRVIND